MFYVNNLDVWQLRQANDSASIVSLCNTLDGLARGSEVSWYGPVLRRDNGNVLTRALDFEVAERRGHGQPNMMWKSIPIRLN